MSIMYFKVLFVLESNHFRIVEVQLLFTTDSPPQSLSDLPQTSCACALIVLDMHKKFEVNWTKIKEGLSVVHKSCTSTILKLVDSSTA